MRIANVARFGGMFAAAVGLTATGLMALAPVESRAQAPQPLKIGVMGGFSGVYADVAGGQVEAAQMAVEDFGGTVLGRKIEVISADHQNKPDIAAALSRKWYDEGVKMITGLDTSSVGLAVRKVAQEKGQIDLNVGAASADLTGPACLMALIVSPPALARPMILAFDACACSM
jgi:branched-chain amino acid transport system substrate-binding protein